MGKKTTLTNIIGQSNGCRAQSCMPKRPVSDNFRTKSLEAKPSRSQDNDFTVNRMVSILDVSMVDVSSPQRNTCIPTRSASQAHQNKQSSVPSRSSNPASSSKSDSQTSTDSGTKTNENHRSNLLAVQDCSIIGNALQETINDDSWLLSSDSDDEDGSFYQTAFSIQTVPKNRTSIERVSSESSESSGAESSELVIVENTLDRRLSHETMEQLSGNDVDNDVSNNDRKEQPDTWSNTLEMSGSDIIGDAGETLTREDKANQNNTGNGYETESYSQASTVVAINKSSHCEQTLQIDQAAVNQPGSKLDDFEIIFNKQIEFKKITIAQIEAIKRIKVDTAAAFDAILRFLELSDQ